ncbi:hypothetical protein V6N11_020138 [Hibiscus sabdariffa]|uniref:Uncharacterized protein n=1 Tax=Hibiscus sabdariffa TaxID=183260 RepID=A0ABR2P9J7_9ROSI
MGGTPVHNQAPSNYVEDLESANGNGGRKVRFISQSHDHNILTSEPDTAGNFNAKRVQGFVIRSSRSQVSNGSEHHTIVVCDLCVSVSLGKILSNLLQIVICYAENIANRKSF